MNKTSKIVSTIVLVLMAVALTKCIYHISKPKAWSKEYISNFRDTLDKSFKFISDDRQRSQVVNCVIEKVKQSLPKGLESVPRDTVYSLVLKYGITCTQEIKNIKGVVLWTEQNEKDMRRSVLKQISDTPTLLSHKLCDCFINKLKNQYPNGVPVSISDSTKKAMVQDCVKELKKTN